MHTRKSQQQQHPRSHELTCSNESWQSRLTDTLDFIEVKNFKSMQSLVSDSIARPPGVGAAQVV